MNHFKLSGVTNLVFNYKGYDIMRRYDKSMFVRKGAAYVTHCLDTEDGIKKIDQIIEDQKCN